MLGQHAQENRVGAGRMGGTIQVEGTADLFGVAAEPGKGVGRIGLRDLLQKQMQREVHFIG